MNLQRSRTLISPIVACLALLLGGLVSTTLAAPPATVVRPVQPRQPEQPLPLLSDEDVELLKVYEVQLGGQGNRAPRITIPKETIREFMEKYREDDRMPRGREAQRRFQDADGATQLQKMFDVRAREFYKYVRVRSQVQSLRDWNRLHGRYILGYFRQHFGQGEVKGLRLLPQGRDEKRVAITNFYILTQTRLDGTALIDRNNPEESLLLQWGLPRSEAKFAAPDIDGWRPYFRNTEDPRFKDMTAWIKSLIRENQGSTYGLTYKIPGQNDQPAQEGEGAE